MSQIKIKACNRLVTPVSTRNYFRFEKWGIAANGLGICDGAAIAFRQPSFVLKLNRITEVQHLTSSRTIANTLLAAVFLEVIITGARF